MKSFIIKKQDEGQRLNRFLEKTVPALYGSLMHKYLRTKRIKLNRRRAEASARLAEGDLLELFIPDEFFVEKKALPDFQLAKPDITVIYEDANIALLYKPAGVLSHDGGGRNPDTVINRYLKKLHAGGEFVPDTDGSFTPALCNRLDRGTSGIVVAAKTRPALAEMNDIIKRRLIEKRYAAAVVAKPPPDGRYTAYLLKKESDNLNLVSVFDHPVPGGKEIITEFKTLARSKNNLWLLSVNLVTGRTHQIRAHLAHLGCPVLGDGKYGSGEINRRHSIDRQALSACGIRFFGCGELPTLGYLDGRSFRLLNVWFAEQFFGVNPADL